MLEEWTNIHGCYYCQYVETWMTGKSSSRTEEQRAKVALTPVNGRDQEGQCGYAGVEAAVGSLESPGPSIQP